MLPRVVGVAIADTGVPAEAGFAEAHAAGRVAAFDAFHVPGDLAI
jgi:hypothetical protein